jgi:hypothetical protein
LESDEFRAFMNGITALRKKTPENYLAIFYHVRLYQKGTIYKKVSLAGCWWLIPVILATQETEIRRIAVQSQPRQIVHETLSRKYSSQKGLAEWLKVKALSSLQY